MAGTSPAMTNGDIARAGKGAYANPMLDALLRRLLERPLERAGRALAPRVSANALTVGGFVAGLVAAGLIAADLAPIAIVFLLLNRVADVLDGAVARVRGPTALGGFLDAALDLIVYAALPFAFAVRRPESGLAAAFLLFGFVTMMTLELAFRYWARRSTTHPATPLFGHGETFVVFAIACALPWAFPVLAYLYGVACFIAGGVRVANAVNHLRGVSEP